MVVSPGVLEAPGEYCASSMREAYLEPKTLTTTRSTTTTSNPAELTAAAVKAPEIAEAILKPARTSMIMNRIIIPRGVLIMSIMLEVVLPDGNLHQPSQEDQRES